MRFRDSLRRIMRERGYTAADVERLSGVNHRLVAMYYRGQSVPMAPNLCRLAKCLGVTMDELWGEGI